MEELQIFNFNSNEVRTVLIKNEPYFCLKDTCKALEIKNHKDVVTRLKKDGVVTTDLMDSLGRNQKATFVNESNLYKIIFRSHKEEAEIFQDWITSEVLPSLRKHGGYILNQETMSPEQLIAQAVVVAQQVIEEKNKKIAELKPKADYCNLILQNKSLVAISQIAKDYGMSAQEFNAKLHELHIQYKQKDQWLLYRGFDDKGYVHSETFNFKHSDGTSDVKMITKWTQKGRLFLYDQLKEEGIIPVIERITNNIVKG